MVPFTDFLGESATPPSAGELGDVASLALDVDGGTQSSFSLSFGALRTIPMPVPEPDMFGSLMVGMVVLVAIGRRGERRTGV